MSKPIIGPSANKNVVVNLQEHFYAMQGPWYFGINLQSLLMGVIIVQSYRYATIYREDAIIIKLSVGLLVLLNLLCLACSVMIGFENYIVHFGDYPALLQISIATRIGVFSMPAVGLIVQIFFAQRSYRMHKSVWLAVIMGLLIALATAGGAGVAMQVSQQNPNREMLLLWVQIANWGIAVTDLFISSIFVFKTHSLGIKKGFNPSTDMVLAELLRMSLSSAGATTIIAMINALSFLLNHTTSQFYILSSMILPCVYTICLLYVLNGRKGLRLLASEGSQPSMASTNTASTLAQPASAVPGRIGVTQEVLTKVSSRRDSANHRSRFSTWD